MNSDESTGNENKLVTGEAAVDPLMRKAIELAAMRNDHGISGLEFAERIVALVEESRADAYRQGKAIGIYQGRNEVIGNPRAQREPGQRKPRMSLNLDDVKEMREKYAAAVEANGGEPPYGFVADLARHYGVDYSYARKLCKGARKENGIDDGTQRNVGMLKVQ